MKTFKYLIRKLSGFFCSRDSVTKADNTTITEVPTLKRAKINRLLKKPGQFETEDKELCKTKQFKCKRFNRQFCWVFTIIEGIDRGREFIGATPELRIGRRPENHICLGDPKVSRFHAVIRIRGSQLIIKDLQSTNGTYINNQRIKREELHPGDRVKVGDTVIQVELEK